MSRVAQTTWHLYDARGQTVGRFAAHLATVLQGKHKATYKKDVDNGDHIVVVNAKDVVFTGDKWQQKVYRKHSGYVGGLKEIPAYRWRETFPERIVMHAVRGMIPKTKHKLDIMSRLHVYGGPKHMYAGQFPGAPSIQGSEKAERLDEVKPVVGLIDNWDFPASFPEALKQEIFGSAEYRAATPEQTAREEALIARTKAEREALRAQLTAQAKLDAAEFVKYEEDEAKRIKANPEPVYTKASFKDMASGSAAVQAKKK